jgi:hypothetical protein
MLPTTVRLEFGNTSATWQANLGQMHVATTQLARRSPMALLTEFVVWLVSEVLRAWSMI